MIPANQAKRLEKAEDPLLKEYSDYEIAEHEQEYYHLLMENKSFTIDGTRLSRPFVQQFTDKEYAMIKKRNNFSGYTVEVIHNPRLEEVISEDDSKSLTVPDIKTKLDEYGVDYPSNAKKKELEKLLVETQKAAGE